MTIHIYSSENAVYQSVLDAITPPIGGNRLSHVVWDEHEGEWVLDHDDDFDSALVPEPLRVLRGTGAGTDAE